MKSNYCMRDFYFLPSTGGANPLRTATNKAKWLSMLCTIALLSGCQNEPNKPITADNVGQAAEPTTKPSPIPAVAPKQETIKEPAPEAPANQPIMEEPPKAGLTPYQVLNKIREIEKFQGGTYQGEWEESEYTFQLPGKNKDRENARYYERSTHDIKVLGENGLEFFYNLFDPATFPKSNPKPADIQVTPEVLQQMDTIEQKLYANEDAFHAEWSPNFQVIAYYEGTTEDGQAYIWKVGDDSPLPIAQGVADRYFFEWSPDSDYLLLDTGTSRHRGGQIYHVTTGKLSEPFSYISQFVFSPDAKWAAFSRLSGIKSPQKYGMEDEETEDMWLYDLTAMKQTKLLQADDHTEYFPREWKSETELLYSKQDYAKNTEEELTVTVSPK